MADSSKTKKSIQPKPVQSEQRIQPCTTINSRHVHYFVNKSTRYHDIIMATTYASPSAIKYLLLTINSIIFSIGMCIATHGIIILIGVSGLPLPYAPKSSEETRLDSSPESVSMSTTTDSDDSSSATSESEAHLDPDLIHRYQDRFPSVGSAAVLFIFGVLTMGSSALGITAIHLDDPALLDTFGYLSFINCFIKFLFFWATTHMHAFRYDYDPFTWSAVAAVFIAAIEVVLGMCACQLAKVLKRGINEDEREIPPLPQSRDDKEEETV